MNKKLLTLSLSVVATIYSATSDESSVFTTNCASGVAVKQKKTDTVVPKELLPANKLPFYYTSGSSFFKGLFAFTPYGFFAKNILLFNNHEPSDRLAYALFHTFDLGFEYYYGDAAKKRFPVVARGILRNQAVWGDPRILLRTIDESIRDTTIFAEGVHRHELLLHVPWVQELWLALDLSELLCLPFCHAHALKIGAFPFYVGRGIALGYFFYRNPNQITVDITTVISQYVFGGLLSGEIIPKKLYYDIYGGILDNRSATFEQTERPVLRNEYGHRNTPQRGFGKINFIAAARLRAALVSEKDKNIYLEPYVVYNNNPESLTEFPADSQRKLGSAGLAFNAAFKKVDFGFDMAFNFGRHHTNGVDRNLIFNYNRDGINTLANTHVFALDNNVLDFALVTPENQQIIRNSLQSSFENEQVIGQTESGVLINAANRFRDPFDIIFKGKMFIFDAGYTVIDPSLRISWVVGFATGGSEQVSTRKIILNDFIGINEFYQGTRVASFFVPLAVSRFSNLIEVGGGFLWQVTACKRLWKVNPNALAYWKYSAPFAFDPETQTDSLIRRARKYIGTELNIQAFVELFPDFKFFAIGALFFPGSFFRDNIGRPIRASIIRLINRENRTGILGNIPVQGADTAYFGYVGFEYRY